MHTVNVAAFARIGFLVLGEIFSVSDLTLSRTPFELMIGPVLWIVGCALMVAWAIGRVGLAVRRSSDVPDGSESGPATGETEPNLTTKSEAAASGSHRRAVAGKAIADFLVPIAIWVMLLSIMATIVLLLGYGPV